jgi:type IV pilus assembly protein PilY1
MLGRLYDLYLDEPTATRTYGLDGEISVYIANDDGNPGISGSEKVILLFGMRRGGDTLYALDVTDRSNPQVLWKVNSSTTGFSRLGQTWSPPVTAKVQVDATIRNVALFGGGYDDAEDATAFRSADSRGNAVYMVDALTGELLWRASGGTGNNLNLSAMTHAIPAGLRVLDLDLDGLADRMYVGDMAGQVWRFDIHNGQPASSLVDGGVFASLGGAAVTAPVPDSAARRFFATPDVARIVASNRAYLSINIGSGHRAHPLDTATDDQFFALRDYKVLDTIATASYPAPIQVTDLVDITGDLAPTIAYNAPGWRLRLDLSAGEKVMTESLTFDNVVLFTSFTPGGQGDACVAAGGLNRLYLVSARDGAPVTNLDGSLNPDGSPDTALTADDRYRELNQGGIAPDPAVFFSPPDGDLSIRTTPWPASATTATTPSRATATAASPRSASASSASTRASPTRRGAPTGTRTGPSRTAVKGNPMTRQRSSGLYPHGTAGDAGHRRHPHRSGRALLPPVRHAGQASRRHHRPAAPGGAAGALLHPEQHLCRCQ